MKKSSTPNLENLKKSISFPKSQKSSLRFQNLILTKTQMSSIKGGEDIVIAEIIGD